MNTLVTVFCVLLIVMAVFLVVAVLMQSGKGKSLSGAIAGSGETFYGKTKGKTADRILSKATIIVSVIFVVIVLAIYVIQAYQNNNKAPEASEDTPAAQETMEEAEDTFETAEQNETAAENTEAEQNTAE